MKISTGQIHADTKTNMHDGRICAKNISYTLWIRRKTKTDQKKIGNKNLDFSLQPELLNNGKLKKMKIKLSFLKNPSPKTTESTIKHVYYAAEFYCEQLYANWAI